MNTSFIDSPPLQRQQVQDAGAQGQGGSQQQKAKWLHELERAQWEQRIPMKSVPHNADGHSTVRSDDAITDPSARGPRIGPADARSLGQPNVQFTHQHSGSPGHSPQTPSAIPADGSRVSVSMLAPSNLNIIRQLVTPTSAPGYSTSSASMLSAFPADRRWQKQHMHIDDKDGQLHLWLRDTSINESQGTQLAVGLSKHFSKLGMHLAQFTLNGRLLALGADHR